MDSGSVVPTPSRKIGVLAIVDAKYIQHNYVLRSTPSAPAIVNPAHIFMVGTSLRSSAGELMLNARIGDVVSMIGTSADHNSSDAVIVYRVQLADQGNALRPFKQSIVTRIRAVEPDPDSTSRDGLPALETPANFSSFESKIRAHGIERIRIEFALYALAQNGQSQILVGYYRSDLNITIASHREGVPQ
ncbi:AidA/PixA family protein [Paraburkholderia aspalathi]|uniref:AidA/PixA family protein n=1 Tax=Paraburkholderia aspalathi TaxID=1324617 RepID=UPI0038BAD878